ncbi:MAG TPA: single-stranded DNA-binding protein [Candidatus Sulfotelmatobacter sp.]|jgi:single-strand DNA-binding protein|nr:single-stranded DNA-binding protein [Candidatus Sulfotelmatobacter sp.]
MARSLNRVQLIGNLTRDPELRYTPNGNAVCTFGLATNRTWTTDSGEKREEVDFHRIVAWNKLAELCSQFLTKGRKVYVEGRLSTRSWTGQDGTQKSTTEVVIDDMILLDNKQSGASQRSEEGSEPEGEISEEQPKAKKPIKKEQNEVKVEESTSEEVSPDDIPF